MDTTVIGAISIGLIVLYLGIRLFTAQKQSPAVLAQKIKNGALVLDVRTTGEFGDGHYNGAVHIPVQELPVRISELEKYKNRCVIVYCATGVRSGQARKLLLQAGFSEVINAGGLFNMPRD